MAKKGNGFWGRSWFPQNPEWVSGWSASDVGKQVMPSWGERKLSTDNCPFKAGAQGKVIWEKLQLPEVSVSRQVATVAMVSENNMAAPRWDLSLPSREVNVDLRGERRHLKGPGAGVGLCGER